MTRREGFLVGTLATLLLCTGILTLAFQLSEDHNRLETEWINLQKLALQLRAMDERQLASRSPEDSSLSRWEDRFWPSGALPSPLELAQVLKPLLDGAELEVREFRVVQATEREFTLRYSLHGPMAAFLDVFLRSRIEAPRLLVRRLAVILEDRGRYRIEWEVGYSVAP